MVRRANSGFSYIEVLVSVLILVMSILAMMSLWSANMSLTEKHGDSTQAYNLGRRVIEQVRLLGFYAVPEGETVLYFDADGGQGSSTESPGIHKFRVTLNVLSDKLSINGETGAVRPSAEAVRNVKLTVVRIRGNRVERTTGTILVRSGI